MGTRLIPLSFKQILTHSNVYLGVFATSLQSIIEETKGIADKACNCWIGVTEYDVQANSGARKIAIYQWF